MADEKLEKVLPIFSNILRKALETEFPGGSVELTKVMAEDESQNQTNTGHYFTLSLPFAGIAVEWEILFDPLQPSWPPDFICAEDIHCNPDVYCRLIKGWNFESTECLAKLIKDLTKVYQEYQFTQVKNFPHVAETVQSLINAGVLEKNIEVCYVSKVKRFSLLIQLDISYEELPSIHGCKSSQGYAGLLYTLGLDGDVISHSLVVSPYLERILGKQMEQLEISCQTVDPSALHDLTTELQGILRKLREDHGRRRHIMSAILDLYPKNVAFYDEYLYNECTLVFTLNDARYVVHLKLVGEMELALFAMDRHIKISKDEKITYNETETIPFNDIPSSPDFLKNLHVMLASRIEKFINRATNLAV